MQEMDDETIYKERDNLVEQINYIAWSMINYLHENKEDVIDLYKDVNHKVPNYLECCVEPGGRIPAVYSVWFRQKEFGCGRKRGCARPKDWMSWMD